jgi:hypothetical protein
MASTQAAVTVAIPTYRRPELLRQSLGSALRQTLEEIEVVVSDNGNDEETAAVVDSFDDPRVTYAPLPENIGPSGNSTRCLTLGTAPYLTILQADDLLMPESVERRLERIESDPSLAIVHTAHAVIDQAGAVTRPMVSWGTSEGDWECDGATFIRRSIAGGLFFHISTAMMRRSMVAGERFEPVGGYDDLGVWLRVASRGGRFAYINQPLTAVREHEQSESALRGLHVVRTTDDGGVTIVTQSFEQIRQMQDVRQQFLAREGATLPGRKRLWRESRRDVRKRLARIIAKDAVAEGSVRRTYGLLREARAVDPAMAHSVWAPSALALAVGGRPARRLMTSAMSVLRRSKSH